MAELIAERRLQFDEVITNVEGNYQSFLEFVAEIRQNLKCSIDLVNPKFGSHHVAYVIIFEDGVKWLLKIPERGHLGCFSECDARAITSEAQTMEYVRQADIPVPQVYAYRASCENPIKCAFILMKFITGKPLLEWWHDGTITPETLEKRRTLVLGFIAEDMAKLGELKFPAGGALQFHDNGKYSIIALRRKIDQSLELGTDAPTPYVELGPFNDPKSFFLCMLEYFRSKDRDYQPLVHNFLCSVTEWALFECERETRGRGFGQTLPQSFRGVIKRALVKMGDCAPMLSRVLPIIEKWDPPTSEFVLAHPELVLHNILVTEHGKPTYIDWDGVATVPGCMANIPSWLISDFHPASSDTPEMVDPYRTQYQNLTPNSGRTRLSMIFHVLAAAADSPDIACGIVVKILGRVDIDPGVVREQKQLNPSQLSMVLNYLRNWVLEVG